MDSVDLQVLKTAVEWTKQGHRALLSTVIRTWGSAPRPIGAMMLIRDDGLVVGSVSGGCIEDDLIARMRQGELKIATPRVDTYGVSGDDARRFGLPCGGTLQIVMEPISEASRITEVLDLLEAGTLVARRLDMATGAVSVAPADSASCTFDGSSLVNTFGPQYRLVIIGGGQLSAYLAQVAQGLDYRVTVCDPREEYADSWTVPGVELLRDMPDDAIVALKLDAHCAVVALTHDPKLDDMALLEALKSPAFYVGAIGSRANNGKRRQRLGLFDLKPEQIERLHGPIGLFIGSKTPPEIAIAILAEMTCVKNGVVPTQTHDKLRPASAEAAGQR